MAKTLPFKPLLRTAALVSVGLLSASGVRAANGLVATAHEAHPGSIVLDGWCADDAYGSRAVAVLLWPAALGAPAGVVRVAWRGDGLWVCVSGIPSSAGGPLDVSIDPGGGAGAFPGPQVVRLELSQAGARSSFRGAGPAGGYVSDSSLDRMWSSAVSGGVGGGPWVGELMISSAITGPLAIGALPGIRFGVDGVAGQTVDWPSQSPFDQPRSWGTVEMAPSVGSMFPPHLDAKWISQGLTWDATSGDPYLFVADKTTLLRAQISGWPLSVVTTANCVAQHYHKSGGQWLPDTQSTWAAMWSGSGTPHPNAYQTSRLDGQPTFDCWLTPPYFSDAGLYDFTFDVAVDGGPVQHFYLGSRELLLSKPFKLLVTPRVDSMIPNLFQPFDAQSSARLAVGVQQLRRAWPVADSKFPCIWASLYNCTESTDGACDAHSRTSSDLYVASYNYWATLNNLKRIDKAVVAANFPAGNGGGQSCWHGGASPTAGAIVTPDASDPGAITMAQEVSHCLGLVDVNSPNFDPVNNAHHSLHEDVPLPAFDPGFVDTIGFTAGTLVPRSIMFPYVDLAADDPRMMFEGYEWNQLYAVDQGLPLAPVAPAPRSRMLEVTGTLTPLDVYTPSWGAVQTNVDPLLPPDAPGTPYALILRQADGSEIGRYPFEVSFEGTHGDTDLLPLTFVVPVPPGLASYAIVKGEVTLFSTDPAAAAPTVTIQTLDPGTTIRLEWSATGPHLHFQVLYDPGEGRPVLPLVTGITDTSYTVPARELAPSPLGRLRVVASNEFASATDTSGAFAVRDASPIAAILAPTVTSPLVAGRPFRLVGTAQSAQGDPVGPDALRWAIDAAPAGTGSPWVTLGPGTHTVRLWVSHAAALPRQIETRTVTVQADTDHDGLPDAYEAAQGCLNRDLADAGADPDGDGLTNAAEYALGTDPCEPDTNADGVSDGDSVQLGIVPRVAPASSGRRPDGPFWFLPSPVQLVCGEAETVSIPVEAAAASTRWRARSNSPALQISAGEHTGPGLLQLTAACASLSHGTYPAQVLVSAVLPQGTPGFMDATRLLDVTVVVP